MNDVTNILSQTQSGDPRAAEQLLPLVYEELRKLAAQRIIQEKPGQTLQDHSERDAKTLQLPDIFSRIRPPTGEIADEQISSQ
jgi:hypothetical protein